MPRMKISHMLSFKLDVRTQDIPNQHLHMNNIVQTPCTVCNPFKAFGIYISTHSCIDAIS